MHHSRPLFAEQQEGFPGPGPKTCVGVHRRARPAPPQHPPSAPHKKSEPRRVSARARSRILVGSPTERSERAGLCCRFSPHSGVLPGLEHPCITVSAVPRSSPVRDSLVTGSDDVSCSLGVHHVTFGDGKLSVHIQVNFSGPGCLREHGDLRTWQFILGCGGPVSEPPRIREKIDILGVMVRSLALARQAPDEVLNPVTSSRHRLPGSTRIFSGSSSKARRRSVSSPRIAELCAGRAWRETRPV